MFTGFFFHQVHLVEFKGWSLETWAALFSVYAVISVLTKIVTGYLVDRFGAIRLVPLISLPMGAGLIVLASSGSLVAGALFLALTGLTVGFYSTLITPFWAEMYGTRYLASIKSMGTAIMALSTALSPILLGWLIDRNVSMNHIAVASALYIFAASGLAAYAYFRRSRSGIAS